MRALCIIVFIQLVQSFRITSLKSQLYGEWSVWHSHEQGSNKIVVGLYPESNIEICYRKYQGPWLIQTRKIGHFYIIGENDQEPLVSIQYNEKEYKILSFLGIGFDDISLTRKDNYPINVDMKLYVVDRNDLFLSMSNKEHYHLVRSVRVNEPDVNVPISTLIATNIFGMLMTELLHYHHQN